MTIDDGTEELSIHRIPRQVGEAVRAITERDPDIESLWVQDDPEPQPWHSTVYSLIEVGGFIIEVRVRYYDVNRFPLSDDAYMVYDKVRNRPHSPPGP
jgi:hypothetical protein